LRVREGMKKKSLLRNESAQEEKGRRASTELRAENGGGKICLLHEGGKHPLKGEKDLMLRSIKRKTRILLEIALIGMCGERGLNASPGVRKKEGETICQALTRDGEGKRGKALYEGEGRGGLLPHNPRY